MLHISFAAETLITIFGFPVTNSLVMAWVTMAVLFAFTYYATRSMKKIPDTMQLIAEIIIGGLYDTFKKINRSHIDLFFPLIGSIFLYVLIGNWMGLLPGVGSIGLVSAQTQEHTQEVVLVEQSVDEVLEETVDAGHVEQVVTSDEAGEVHEASFIPLFRPPTADLNTTFAIAIVAVVAIQYYGFRTLGSAYSKKYINFKSPIFFFVGILEIISEAAKILSFAFRLFGNIFAGEVLLAVVAFLIPIIAPLPFIGLEIFVGFIQALVFAMLTAVFLNVATQSEH